MDQERRVRVTISGRVQGVGYRDWTRQEAWARGLSGFVRNRRDGTVEAIFIGPAEPVAALCAACWQGPPAAQVTEVIVEEVDGAVAAEAGTAGAFRLLPTL
jgi:acylphosphatase